MASQNSPATVYKTNRAFVSVDYDEFKPETYRGVTVEGHDETKRFCTENPLQDVSDAYSYALEHFGLILSSSSVVHFSTDLLKAAKV